MIIFDDEGQLSERQQNVIGMINAALRIPEDDGCFC
jgi:hypothetical protein